MKWLFFHYSTFIEFEQPVKRHQFVLRCMPATNGRQRVVSSSVSIKPSVPFEELTDGFGNLIQSGNVPFEHTSFHYSTDGEVFVSTENRELSPLNPVFKYPSELTRPSPRMRDFLDLLPLSGNMYEDAALISNELQRYVNYASGRTRVDTTASEAFDAGAGVCQDFAHIFISLARLAKMPARYANGLLEGESSSHAWAEVYIDGCWIGFDPTRNCLANENYVRFSVGRDFNDCPMERGVFFGHGGQTQIVEIKVHEASQMESAAS
jgi:transglutaminase-like putative cysteine protease